MFLRLNEKKTASVNQSLTTQALRSDCASVASIIDKWTVKLKVVSAKMRSMNTGINTEFFIWNKNTKLTLMLHTGLQESCNIILANFNDSSDLKQILF